VDLKEICRPIEKDLEDFEKEFEASLRSEVFLIDKVVRYIVRHRGKRFRPILVLLTSRLAGQWEPRASKAATIVELLHTATLIHDDVVDRSMLRRGAWTVNALWKNKVSVLMGDYLFAQAFQTMLELRSLEVIEVISRAARRMSQGELLQVERSRDFRMEESTYFRLIADKTAALIGASCELGALASHQTAEQRKALRDFGENLGIAFQIRDDLLDYIGLEKTTGKPIGNDLRGNKVTLPLLHAIENSSWVEARRVIHLVRKSLKKENFDEVVAFVKAKGGITYAMEQAQAFAQKAVETLSLFPDSPYKASLTGLVEFVTVRDH